MRKLVLVMILLMTFGIRFEYVTAEASDMVFYVSENGNDSGDGSRNHPFLSLERAKDAVKSALSLNRKQNITVKIEDGSYNLSGPLTFTSADSPDDGYQVRYEGEGKAIFVSHLNKTGWEKYGDLGLYRINLGNDTADTVIENGVRSHVAEYPNNGHLTAASVPDGGEAETNRFWFTELPTGLSTDGVLSVNLWPGGPEGYYRWISMDVTVSDIDYNNKVITLSNDVDYSIGEGSIYKIRNSLSLLDTPGESFFDESSGYLYYYPLGEFDESNIVIISKNEFARFIGVTSAPVENITLDGIVFANNGDHVDGITMTNSRNIGIKNCEIYGTGGCGIYCGTNTFNSYIYGNYIHDVGKQGIYLNGNISTVVNNSHNIVSNNLICRMGRLIEFAEGIRIQLSENNTISHNRIFDGYGTGITSVGTTINIINNKITAADFDKYQRGKNNIIEFNDISNVNKLRQDSGLIYTARSKGNLIRNNVLHDSYIPFMFGFGMYVDDESDFSEVYNNVVHSLQNDSTGYTDEGGVLRYPYSLRGSNIKFYNNIAADCNVDIGAVLIRGANESVYENKGIAMYGNIMQNCKDVIYNDFSYYNRIVHNSIKSSDNNLWYDEGYSDYRIIYGQNKSIAVDNLKSSMKLSFEENSVFAEPKFMDISGDDFRLHYTSPAYEVGFKDIDYMSVGLNYDFLYADRMEDVGSVFVRTADCSADKTLFYAFDDKPLRLNVYSRTKSGFMLGDGDFEVSYDSDTADVTDDGYVSMKNISETPSEVTVTVTKNGKSVTRTVYVQFCTNNYIKWNYVDLYGNELTAKPNITDVKLSVEIPDSTDFDDLKGFAIEVVDGNEKNLGSYYVDKDFADGKMKFAMGVHLNDINFDNAVYVYKVTDDGRMPYACFSLND